MKNLFKEVYAQIVALAGQSIAELICSKYKTMEDCIKFSNIDILKLDDIEQFEFPMNIEEFKTELSKIKEILSKGGNKEAVDAINDIVQYLPKEKAEPTTSLCWYNPDESQYEGRFKNCKMKEGPKVFSEPKEKIVKQIVSDFIELNELRQDIEDELDECINYYASKLRGNETSGKYDKDIQHICLIKLAAYFNLHSNNKYQISSPDINVSGNKVFVELALYNSFLKAIIAVSSFWSHRIFDLIDKKLIAKNSQFDIIYKAISTVVGNIINSKMDSFVKDCFTKQQEIKSKPKVKLTETECAKLDEMFVTLLNKRCPGIIKEMVN